jgi:uncharacterized membrane protein
MIARANPVANRSRRVVVLLAGVVILSLADLVITLEHLRSFGMFEANPIAAYIVRATGSPWALASFKVVTVATCVALLFRARRHGAGEAAAWCALAIMTALSFWWSSYASALESPIDLHLVQQHGPDEWLRLGAVQP